MQSAAMSWRRAAIPARVCHCQQAHVGAEARHTASAAPVPASVSEPAGGGADGLVRRRLLAACAGGEGAAGGGGDAVSAAGTVTGACRRRRRTFLSGFLGGADGARACLRCRRACLRWRSARHRRTNGPAGDRRNSRHWPTRSGDHSRCPTSRQWATLCASGRGAMASKASRSWRNACTSAARSTSGSFSDSRPDGATTLANAAMSSCRNCHPGGHGVLLSAVQMSTAEAQTPRA